MPRLNLGFNQRNFNGTKPTSTAAINMGTMRGKGSTSRMFNYCTQRSANPSECINQFINVVTPVTTPIPFTAPIITNIVDGNTQLTVSFTGPTSSGGYNINNYEYSTNNGTSFTNAATTSSPITITGLTNGTTYQIVIRAISDNGYSPNSNVVSAVPVTVPSAPLNPIASNGTSSGSANISWSVPSSNGGSAILTYTITSTPGSNTLTTSNTSGVITGLTNGTPYTFTVYATNAVGNSSNSAASNSITPSPPTYTFSGTGTLDQATVNAEIGSATIIIIEGYDSIDVYAFLFKTQITSVTIGTSVTSIGESSFEGCSSLTSVTLGNSVTTIGAYAFAFCSSLTSIVIPTSVNDIDSFAFTGSALTTVYIADGQIISGITFTSPDTGVSFFGVTVATVNSVIFSGTGTLDEATVNAEIGSATIIIIEGYDSIGDNAFLFKNQITSVTIGTSVTSIGVQAFRASGLTSITIPDSVTSIGNYAFYNCSALTSVVIPSIVTSIGDGVFAYCFVLTSVVIPSSVTSIGVEAFYNCFFLTSVTIGSSVTSIGVEAFYNCSALTSVVIPASVNAIDSTAFTGSALSTVYIADGQIISGITFTSPDTGVSFFGVTVATELPP